MIELRPQQGPQEAFLASSADIAIYGGAAGGGKSFALLLEPLRHVSDPEFRAVIFRRTSKQVRNEGGLWDASFKIYNQTGAVPKETGLLWEFPSGATISFGSVEHEKNKYDWQGTEITYLGFDELTHFSESQFFYLLSRNRSTSGIRPYVRATCNPDADSWVANFINWWIDDKTGCANLDRSGLVQQFKREDEKVVFVDQLDNSAKSLTFISASIEDNKILMDKDPGYKDTLATLSRIERERLLNGNWHIRPTGGNFFRPDWFSFTKESETVERTVRGWDLASVENGGDWTVGVKMSLLKSGLYRLDHVERFQGRPHEVEQRIKATAERDGPNVTIALPQDPGQAGKSQAHTLAKLLAGYRLRISRVTGSKTTRAAALSAQVEAGNVLIRNGYWSNSFINELHAFPEGKHDDQVDAAVEAFTALVDKKHYTQQDMY